MSEIVTSTEPVPRGGRHLPWLPLGLAAAALLVCAALAAVDQRALAQDWGEWGSMDRLRGIGGSLSLLVAAAVLATSSGFAVAAALRSFPTWLRKAAAAGCKALAVFPFAAIVWTLAGFWLGRLHWPIESLMPAPAAGAAGTVWKWLLPLILLAAPLAAELATWLLIQPRLQMEPGLTGRGLNRSLRFYHHELPRLWRLGGGKIQRLVLLGAAYLVFLEDALDLPGAGAFFAAALRSGETSPLLAASVAWLALTAAGCLLIWVLHRTFTGWPAAPVERRSNASAALIEGGVVIGLSRRAAWRRHVLPRQVRTVLGALCIAASWTVVWTMLITAISRRGPGAFLGGAGMLALDDYRAPLAAAAVPALWALSLWLLGRMMAPRPLPQTHGRNPT